MSTTYKITAQQEDILQMLYSEGLEVDPDGPMPGDCSASMQDFIDVFGTQPIRALRDLIDMGLVNIDEGPNPGSPVQFHLTAEGMRVADRLHNG